MGTGIGMFFLGQPDQLPLLSSKVRKRRLRLDGGVSEYLELERISSRGGHHSDVGDAKLYLAASLTPKKATSRSSSC